MSLGSKLLVGVLSIALSAILCMGLVTAVGIYQDTLVLGRNLLEGSVAQARGSLDVFSKTTLARVETACDLLAARVDPASLDEGFDADSRIVDDLRARHGAAASIFLKTDQGFLRISSTTLKDGKRMVGGLIENAAVASKLEGGQAHTAVTNVAGEWRLAQWSPVTRDGRTVGAVFVGFPVFTEELTRYLDSLNIAGKGYPFILSDAGRVVFHPNASLLGEDPVERLPALKGVLASGSGCFEYEWAGEGKITCFQRQGGTGWLVGVGMNKRDMLHGLDDGLVRAGLIGVGAAVLVSLLGVFFMVRAVMRPMTSIAQASDRIAGGDYNVHIDYQADDAVGATARSVERLAATVKEKLGFIQGVLEGIKSPNVVGDREGRILHLNQAMIDFLQVDGAAGAWLGRRVSELVYADAARTSVLEQVVADRQPRIGVELRVVTRQGEEKDVRIDSVPLYDLDGELLGACSIWTDLTDIKAKQGQIEGNRRVRELARQVDAFSQHVASASEELAAQIEQASRGTEQQRDRTAETATAMEEMNATVLEVARNAGQAVEGARGVQVKSKEGASVVNQVMQAMSHVNDMAQLLRAEIGELGRQAQGITSVIGVINDIADQTNLLALNAAIEAARAGDAGRGFAVVADEVRKLAERTVTATKEVGSSIGGITRTVEKNIKAVAEASEAIADSNTLASQASETLKQILAISGQAADQIASIATAAEEQSATTEQINRAVDEVSVIAGETAEAMLQSAQAVSDLARQVADLKTLVSRMVV